ncbi:hypothetical protein H4Q26_012360 [Puccinia striiformis f. sp. tritici PST-130]|nr:hypothetical protein H4Q26_012360 [Puccinia striiformis f. sp. tritici PST-130]
MSYLCLCCIIFCLSVTLIHGAPMTMKTERSSIDVTRNLLHDSPGNKHFGEQSLSDDVAVILRHQIHTSDVEFEVGPSEIPPFEYHPAGDLRSVGNDWRRMRTTPGPLVPSKSNRLEFEPTLDSSIFRSQAELNRVPQKVRSTELPPLKAGVNPEDLPVEAGLEPMMWTIPRNDQHSRLNLLGINPDLKSNSFSFKPAPSVKSSYGDKKMSGEEGFESEAELVSPN